MVLQYSVRDIFLFWHVHGMQQVFNMWQYDDLIKAFFVNWEIW